jgi:hypothetical protein
MRRTVALLAAIALAVSLASPGAAAPPPATGQQNSFVGNFDLVEQGTTNVVGHVVANFREPTRAQLVPGTVDIYWTAGDPRSGSSARESHAQILEAWFWDGSDPAPYQMARVIGTLCDYSRPQNGACDPFAMVFAKFPGATPATMVGFSVPGSTECCSGLWFDVGKGGFVLNYVGPTPEPAFLERAGTELVLGGQPFHEISFDAFDLLNMSLGGRASAARDQLATLGKLGFRVVRVMASPYDAPGIERLFFDEDAATQAAKRAEYFATFDALLDACDADGIRIVASLMWNVANIGELGGHSVRDGMTNPSSLGRQRVEEYIREVVTRYADRPTIAMWELGNEWNNGADIQWPEFGYTSDDLAAYYQATASLIRSIDARHLITTGDSSPRAAAMHLLRAVREGKEPDWTPDTAAELTEYLALTNPDPIDVVSIHYYDDSMLSMGGTLGSPANLRFFKDVADQMGKPLFVGEIGCTAAVGCIDGGTAALPMLRETLPVLVDLKLPLTLYWNYAATVPTEAVRLIRQADRRVQ